MAFYIGLIAKFNIMCSFVLLYLTKKIFRLLVFRLSFSAKRYSPKLFSFGWIILPNHSFTKNHQKLIGGKVRLSHTYPEGRFLNKRKRGEVHPLERVSKEKHGLKALTSQLGVPLELPSQSKLWHSSKRAEIISYHYQLIYWQQ